MRVGQLTSCIALPEQQVGFCSPRQVGAAPLVTVASTGLVGTAVDLAVTERHCGSPSGVDAGTVEDGPKGKVKAEPGGVVGMGAVLTVGQAARASDLTPEVVRLYERRGLLPRPARSPAGYRAVHRR